MSKKIILTKGKETIVSDEDYETLKDHRWYASQTNNKFYAARIIQRNGKNKVVYMHREIMKATEKNVDHIDGNTLNNQRSNLRFVEHRQNLMNQQPQKNRSSKYKGVYIDPKNKTWIVQIKDRQKMRHVTGIENEEIAACIYDLLALDRFKEFARFNFPVFIQAWNRRADDGEKRT